MEKKDALKHWNELPENLEIMPHFTAIPYGASGSKYGACGIRIDGNPAFVDAVLSRLKDLLAGENSETRLSLSRNKVEMKLETRHGTRTFLNRDDSAECCYIRLCERGGSIHHGRALKSRARVRPTAA